MRVDVKRGKLWCEGRKGVGGTATRLLFDGRPRFRAEQRPRKGERARIERD